MTLCIFRIIEIFKNKSVPDTVPATIFVLLTIPEMVNFYLKDKDREISSVIIQVFVKGRRYKFSSGISVVTEFWMKDKQKCRVNSRYLEGEVINTKLDSIRKTISDNARKFEFSNQVPTVYELKAIPINNSLVVEFMTAYRDKSGFSSQTLRKYTTTINKLKAYEEYRGVRLTFDDLTISFYREFKKWLYGLLNKKTNLPYSRNYFGSLIKVIKATTNRAREEGVTKGEGTRHSQFKTLVEVTTAVYLSIEELTSIHILTFTRELIEPFYKGIREADLKRKIRSYEIVRARFLLGAFSALRVSDFLTMPPESLQGDMIRHRTKKTGQDVVIPVHPLLRSVIDSGWLSYMVSEQKVNLHIKEICRMAGITEMVTTHREQGGVRMSFTHPKSDLVTTHTARRSAATNMYKAGIPAISIMKITGHRTQVSFMKYIRITEEENAELLKSHPYFSGK